MKLLIKVKRFAWSRDKKISHSFTTHSHTLNHAKSSTIYSTIRYTILHILIMFPTSKPPVHPLCIWMMGYVLNSPLKINYRKQTKCILTGVTSILFRHKIHIHLFKSKFTIDSRLKNSGRNRVITLGGMGSCDVLWYPCDGGITILRRPPTFIDFTAVSIPEMTYTCITININILSHYLPIHTEVL